MGGFAFIADSHISSRGIRSEIGHEDSIFALKQAVEYCLKEEIPLVIGGDLFHRSRPESWLLAKANEVLNLMPSGSVWAIQGNHDLDPEFPWFSHCQVAHFDQKAVEIGSYRVYGADYAPSQKIAEKLLNVPQVDILVGHQALKQGLGFDQAWNMDLNWVQPQKVRHLLMGDLHRVYQTLRSDDGQVTALYSGVQYATKADEIGQHSLIRVFDRPRDFPDVQLPVSRIPLLERPMLRLSIESEEQFNRLIPQIEDFAKKEDQDLPPELRRPILIIRYYKDIDGVETLVKEICDRSKVIFIADALPARSAFNLSHSMIQVEEGLTIGKAVQRRAEQLKGQLKELASRFGADLALASTNEQISQVISSWKAKILEESGDYQL